ncbi:PepSY domain-containing protein [Halomonas qinghailakensis]|uniref:PepSY domain-containing protein n=2 Tax=Halomonas TaxID=2745 RepID=A0AA46TTN1_9GAMM|nr:MULTISPECIES: PepSY domain-containing protein [Halomonas]UYO76152.1 PepSY domain-containing protein [Halomonas sp. ZZQ-149]UYV18944.1 PepSY domain-containing protein [Halomonas qaidamensis]
MPTLSHYWQRLPHMRLCKVVPVCVVATVFAIALAGSAAIADQHWETLHSEVRRGDVVPLESILDWLEANYIGEVIEVEIEREDGHVEYEIKLLGAQNQVVEFEFDGHSGQLMKIEGVRINEMRRQ